MHHAALSGCADCAELLLARAAPGEVERADASGLRPIDQAVCGGRRDVVSAFLRKGAKLGPTTWAMAKDKPGIL